VPSEGNGDTNLACVIRHNSSLVCVGRPGLGLMRADHWRNVSGYTWYPIHYGSGEDPMIWLDRSGSEEGGGGSVEVLHAVLHGGGWGDPFGHHYWSAYLIFIPFGSAAHVLTSAVRWPLGAALPQVPTVDGTGREAALRSTRMSSR